MNDYSRFNEQCFVRLNNWRDPVVEEVHVPEAPAEPVRVVKLQKDKPGQASSKSLPKDEDVTPNAADDKEEEEQFNPESVPHKLILLNPQNTTNDVTMIVFNPGKPFS